MDDSPIHQNLMTAVHYHAERMKKNHAPSSKHHPKTMAHTSSENNKGNAQSSEYICERHILNTWRTMFHHQKTVVTMPHNYRTLFWQYLIIRTQWPHWIIRRMHEEPCLIEHHLKTMPIIRTQITIHHHQNTWRTMPITMRTVSHPQNTWRTMPITMRTVSHLRTHGGPCPSQWEQSPILGTYGCISVATHVVLVLGQ